MVAAKLEKFSVSNETLAEAAQGSITAQDTVQGQLSSLMQDFNDGTPAWAAGAIRAANSAMLARGLGGKVYNYRALIMNNKLPYRIVVIVSHYSLRT